MANSSLKKVFNAITADADSASLDWPGGVGQMVVSGGFGGGTCKLQMSPDDGTTWVDVGGDSSVTAAAVVNFDLNGCDIRLSLSGSTAPTLSGWLTETVQDGIWGKGIMHCPQ